VNAEDDFLPLQQSAEYGSVLQSRGVNVRKYKIQSADKIEYAQIIERRILGIKFAGLFLGKISSISDLSSRYKKRKGEIFFYSRDNDQHLLDHHQLRLKISPRFSYALLEIKDDIAAIESRFNQKWRNAAKAFLKSDAHLGRASEDDLKWILSEENKQRSERKYNALPHWFTEEWLKIHPQQHLSLIVKNNEKDKVAGAVFLITGKTAHYHIAYSNVYGRRLKAHNGIIWQAIKDLKLRGCRWINMGSLEKASNPGIDLFKLGVGAERISTSGSYIDIL
jgi:hypothetical protein